MRTTVCPCRLHYDSGSNQMPVFLPLQILTSSVIRAVGCWVVAWPTGYQPMAFEKWPARRPILQLCSKGCLRPCNREGQHFDWAHAQHCMSTLFVMHALPRCSALYRHAALAPHKTPSKSGIENIGTIRPAQSVHSRHKCAVKARKV